MGTPNPFGLADQVAPPPWHGPAHVHRLDDLEPRKPGTRKPSTRKPVKLQPQAADCEPTREEVEQLARQAVDALMVVLPPWTLLTPGSPKEQLALSVSPGLYWPFPGTGQ